MHYTTTVLGKYYHYYLARFFIYNILYLLKKYLRAVATGEYRHNTSQQHQYQNKMIKKHQALDNILCSDERDPSNL